MCSINSTKSPELVQIGKCPLSSFRVISLIDKFFFLGLVAGIIGGLGFGSYLWLAFSGLLAVPPSLNLIRQLHSILQINIFLGSFILGFCLHAAPKLIGSRNFANSVSIFLLPSLIVGGLLSALFPASILGPIFVALPFALVGLFILRLSFQAAFSSNLWLAYPLITGLVALSYLPFDNALDPYRSLALFWVSIMQIIFASGQQFISGMLGGKRLSASSASVILLVNLWVGCLLLLSPSAAVLSMQLSAAIVIQSTLYIWGTRSNLAFYQWRSSAFALSIAAGNLWLLASALMLSFNVVPVDYVLHSLALGYALPITISTSCRIISALSAQIVLPERQLVGLIALWQLVPGLRLLHLIWPDSHALNMLLLLVALSVLGTWSWRLGRVIFKMNR